MTELKPCPFCGGIAEVVGHRRSINGWVECSVCHSSTDFMDKTRAIEVWNRRVDE